MSHTINVRFEASRPAAIAVNGTTITREAIAREIQNHPADKPITAWQQAARALIVRELLLQRARYLGLKAEPASDDEGRRETDEEALVRAVVEIEVTVPEPDDETCRRYYERNLARFRSSDIYETSHILFSVLPGATDAYAQARADAVNVLAILQENPDSFAAFARAYSSCPSAAHDGNLGQITRGQTTPEFEAALMKLQPGELCAEPVTTRYGFHIIRLERRHDGRTLPYEHVAAQIAEYLRDNVTRRAAAQYVGRLVSSAQIEGIDLVSSAETLRVH